MASSPCFTRLPISRCSLQRHVSFQYSRRRNFTVLAIETSCDDTSVAILHSPSSSPSTATILAHKTITSPNRIYGGIHPLVSVEFHRSHLAPLVSSVLHSLPGQRKPDLVAATRGPGMLASLAVGLDTAKGLALAWGVPLIGVNHMQAHALTPRLLSALRGGEEETESGILAPVFPFMTLLVSGGHTMVLKSCGLMDHTILAKTTDIALGDVVDKCARTILPTDVLEQRGEAVAYGAVLEEYCFSDREREEDVYQYHVDGSAERKSEDEMHTKKWGDWKLSKPLTKTGLAKKLMEFTFTGLGSTLDRYFESKITTGGEVISEEERKELGRKLMMLAFEHVASRVVMGLDSLGDDEKQAVKHLVVSGGVAANRFLKHMLKRYLEARGYPNIQLVVPPQKYCTDNAAMIAWAGLEIYRAGWETDMMALPMRKWSLDNSVHATVGGDVVNEHGTGGVLGVAHWKRRDTKQVKGREVYV